MSTSQTPHTGQSFEIHFTFQSLSLASVEIPPLSAGLLQNLVHGQMCCARGTGRVQADTAEKAQLGGTNRFASNLAVNENTGEVSPFPRIRGGIWLNYFQF